MPPFPFIVEIFLSVLFPQLQRIFTSALQAVTFVVLSPTELGFCSVVREKRRDSVEFYDPPSLAALTFPHISTLRNTFMGLPPIFPVNTQ